MLPEEPPGRLGRALALLHRIEDGLLAALLGGMILLACAQIVLRNLFDTGIASADPLLRAGVLWLGLLGALAASRGNRQISIDALSRLLAPRGHAAARALTSLFTTAVCGLVAWHAVALVRLGVEAGATAFAGVPAGAVEAVIPLAFGLIALRYALLACAQALLVLRGGPEA